MSFIILLRVTITKQRAHSVLFKKEDGVHIGSDYQIHLDIKYNSKVEVKPKALLENCIYLFLVGQNGQNYQWQHLGDLINIAGLVR